jgi:hypothetical protein
MYNAAFFLLSLGLSWSVDICIPCTFHHPKVANLKSHPLEALYLKFTATLLKQKGRNNETIDGQERGSAEIQGELQYQKFARANMKKIVFSSDKGSENARQHRYAGKWQQHSSCQHNVHAWLAGQTSLR